MSSLECLFALFSIAGAAFLSHLGTLKGRRPGSSCVFSAALRRSLFGTQRTIAEIDDLIRLRVTTYPLLWALFEPGVRVVANTGGHERFFLIEECEYNHEKGYLGVVARFLDWEGEKFGYSTGCLAIYAYGDTKAITDLSVYSVSSRPSRERVGLDAVTCGQRFRDLCNFHYIAYSGLIQQSVEGKVIEKNVGIASTNNTNVKYTDLLLLKIDGRIVIDTASYFYAKLGMPLTGLDSAAISPQIHAEDDRHKPEIRIANKNAFDDIIEGKGLGVVMLFANNPGTGMTLAAEAIADKIQKPLYILSAGELGQNADDVRRKSYVLYSGDLVSITKILHGNILNSQLGGAESRRNESKSKPENYK
ncbi:hypothetical protein BBP40_009931 [Aspergillus hancockii]|nr:hypothetical protein BBP40_009931 [Aspergillus hancockii]